MRSRSKIRSTVPKFATLVRRRSQITILHLITVLSSRLRRMHSITFFLFWKCNIIHLVLRVQILQLLVLAQSIKKTGVIKQVILTTILFELIRYQYLVWCYQWYLIRLGT